MATAKRHRRGSREVLLEHRAKGATLEAACRAAGISTRTGYRWEREPGYPEDLAALQERMSLEAGARLVAEADGAVATLVELTGSWYPPTVRQRAAEAILRHGELFRKGHQTEHRLALAEQRVADQDRIIPAIRAFHSVMFGSESERERVYELEVGDEEH